MALFNWPNDWKATKSFSLSLSLVPEALYRADRVMPGERELGSRLADERPLRVDCFRTYIMLIWLPFSSALTLCLFLSPLWLSSFLFVLLLPLARLLSLRNLTQLESHTECIQESTRLFSLFLFDSFISFPALLCEERKKKKKKRIARRYICEAPGFIGSCCLSPCVSISQGSAISRLPYGRRGGGAARSISRWIMILFCVCSSSSPPSSLPPPPSPSMLRLQSVAIILFPFYTAHTEGVLIVRVPSLAMCLLLHVHTLTLTWLALLQGKKKMQFAGARRSMQP